MIDPPLIEPVIIYCDGACFPNNSAGTGGYAAVLLYKGHRKEISGAVGSTTNNRMEMTAALKALELIEKPRKIIIRTDSQYVCNAFNKKWLANWRRNGWKTSQGGPVLNQDLWEALLLQVVKHRITWEWVRGHSDNVENNRCDELAVQARQEYDQQRRETNK